MTKAKILEQAMKEMKKELKNRDVEVAHSKADSILCDTLKKLGFEDLVKVWDKVPKYYA